MERLLRPERCWMNTEQSPRRAPHRKAGNPAGCTDSELLTSAGLSSERPSTHRQLRRGAPNAHCPGSRGQEVAFGMSIWVLSSRGIAGLGRLTRSFGVSRHRPMLYQFRARLTSRIADVYKSSGSEVLLLATDFRRIRRVHSHATPLGTMGSTDLN